MNDLVFASLVTAVGLVVYFAAKDKVARVGEVVFILGLFLLIVVYAGRWSGRIGR